MTCFNINPDFDINLEHILHEAKKINNFNNRSIDQFRKQFFQYDLVSLSNVLQKCKTGREFEIFVAQIFEYVGIKVIELTSPSSDKGRDIIIEIEDTTVYVECKRYTTNNVGSEVIRKLAGSMQEFEIKKGIIITTSDFTKEARKIKNLPIELCTWSDFVKKYIRDKLLNIDNYKTICRNIQCQMEVTHDIKQNESVCIYCDLDQNIYHLNLDINRILIDNENTLRKGFSEGPERYSLNHCPQCGGRLKTVKPKKYSSKKFKPFIGCTNYPRCSYSKSKNIR